MHACPLPESLSLIVCVLITYSQATYVILQKKFLFKKADSECVDAVLVFMKHSLSLGTHAQQGIL